MKLFLIFILNVSASVNAQPPTQPVSHRRIAVILPRSNESFKPSKVIEIIENTQTSKISIRKVDRERGTYTYLGQVQGWTAEELRQIYRSIQFKSGSLMMLTGTSTMYFLTKVATTPILLKRFENRLWVAASVVSGFSFYKSFQDTVISSTALEELSKCKDLEKPCYFFLKDQTTFDFYWNYALQFPEFSTQTTFKYRLR